MSAHPFRSRPLAAAVAVALFTVASGQALGTGFQLNENSGSSIGNAFAAGAAFTDDVTAMWWNPAALSQFPRIQAAGVLHIITPSIKFRNDGSLPALNQPLGGDGGNAGGANFVPNAYVSVPINPQWTFGVGINAPFGLKTEYDDGWLGRYQALKSQIKTINVNPAISWKVTPEFSIGAGANWQWLKATLTQNVNYSAALLGAASSPPANIPPLSPTWNAIAAATPGLDGKARIEADDTAWGWNIGFAWDATPQLRLAAAYRSEMKYHLTGNVDYDNPTPAPPSGTPPALVGTIAALSAGLNNARLFDRGVSADIKIPQIVNVSMVYRIDPQWEVMADAQWTGWSSIPALSYVTTPEIPAVPLNWDDTWKISAGASYRYNSQWKARFGVAYDQTPVTNEPTPRLPDSNRWWFAVGGEYKPTPNWKFDAGFVYISASSPSFSDRNAENTALYGSINGKYDASVTIFSLQAAYTF
jgi:long-chain fatty acid transport protein